MAIRNHLLILSFIVVMQPIRAQLCVGSLGDPVVNIDFGAGPNPGPSPSFPINYGFVSSDCPNDNFYTIRNNTTACFGDSWHSLTKDHTSNANGYFMLVNASFTPGDFYVDTVRGLCPKTTFEFSAWIINVLKPSACQSQGIQPDLTFTIETAGGTILQSFYTQSIPATSFPEWKQYGFFFQTPVDVSDVVVRIRNNAPGGCGNDLALDDITFRPCGPQITASIQGEAGIEVKNICDYQTTSYILTGNLSQGYSNPAYQWQVSTDNINWSDIPAAVNPTYERKPTATGNYYYRMTVTEAENIGSPNCRITSNVIRFTVEGKPVPMAGSNSPVCEGAQLTLSASGGSTYVWTGPDNFSASGAQSTINDITQTARGTYYVTVTSAAGCVQNDSTMVEVVPRPVASAGDDIGICEGSSTILSGTATGSFSWSPSTGLSQTDVANPVASPADSIVYTLTTQDQASGCSATDSVAVFVYRKPGANAGTDKAIIEGESTTLQGIVSGTEISFNWTPATYISNSTLLAPVVSPVSDAVYTLHAVSNVGCGSASDDVFVRVYKKVIVPNAFSPNRDGINDTWQIVALDAYPNAVVSVFNRYGQAVFTSTGTYTPWNGRYNNADLPVGTYYYVIDVKEGLPVIKGWVTILR